MGTTQDQHIHGAGLPVHVGKVGEKGMFSKSTAMSQTQGLQNTVLKQCLQEKSQHQHIPDGRENLAPECDGVWLAGLWKWLPELDP